VKLDNKWEKSYLKAIKNYYVNKSKTEGSEEINSLLTKINSKLPNSTPDTLVNEIEFLQIHLYKPSELAVYYKLAKENNFDLSQKILQWVKKLMKLISSKE
jgi:hypothetical protein